MKSIKTALCVAMLFMSASLLSQADSDTTTYVIQLKVLEDGSFVIDPTEAEEVMKNVAGAEANEVAKTWSEYITYENALVTTNAMEEVSKYRQEQEGTGIINFFVTDFGGSGVSMVDTNVAVKLVKYDYEQDGNDSINHLYFWFREGAQSTSNKVEFTTSIGEGVSWSPITAEEAYSTNIVINSENYETLYYKIRSSANTGFFRFVGSIKAINIGEGIHVKNSIIINGVPGASHEGTVGESHFKIVGGVFVAGTINLARVIEDTTGYDDDTYEGLSVKTLTEKSASKTIETENNIAVRDIKIVDTALDSNVMKRIETTINAPRSRVIKKPNTKMSREDVQKFLKYKYVRENKEDENYVRK